MSRVFLATERALGRRVVIKVLPEEAAFRVGGGVDPCDGVGHRRISYIRK